MLAAPPEIAGFATWWRSQRERTAATATLAEVGPQLDRNGTRIRLIEWQQAPGIRIGGWLCEPAQPPTCGLIVGHGYAGRRAPDPGCLPAGAVGLFPCMPGFDRSAAAHLPADADTHVLHGIAERDTYLLRDCVEALWRAFDVLAARFPGLPLGYLGSSFGGGLGALAMPWEDRCRAVVLELPTFGNHPLRLATPCTGSGEAVRRYSQQHPHVTAVLAWYDAAVAARHLRCATLIAPAATDPAVPPGGQWSIAEAVPTAVIHPLTAGHPIPPREAITARRVYRTFLGERLSGAASSGK